MAKITLASILGGFASVVGINSRLQQVEDELNQKVLYRDNPIGEDNTMTSDLDMNGNDILNINAAQVDTFQVDDLTVDSITSLESDIGVATGTSLTLTGDLSADNIDASGIITTGGNRVMHALTAGSPNVTVTDNLDGTWEVDGAALGGGDVFLAGNQTFTGTNLFSGTLSTPNHSDVDTALTGLVNATATGRSFSTNGDDARLVGSDIYGNTTPTLDEEDHIYTRVGDTVQISGKFRVEGVNFSLPKVGDALLLHYNIDDILTDVGMDFTSGEAGGVATIEFHGAIANITDTVPARIRMNSSSSIMRMTNISNSHTTSSNVLAFTVSYAITMRCTPL